MPAKREPKIPPISIAEMKPATTSWETVKYLEYVTQFVLTLVLRKMQDTQMNLVPVGNGIPANVDTEEHNIVSQQ